MRARFRFVFALVALAAVMAATPVAPPGHGAAAQAPPQWAGSQNLLALTVYAQSEPAQEPVEPAPQPEPEPVDPEPVEPQPEPAEEAAEESAEETRDPEPTEQVEPEPETADPEPEPDPEPPTPNDFWSRLQTAITAERGHQATVETATTALEDARQNLINAEQNHAEAMEGQGERNADIRAAAQAFVDFLTASYLQSQE